MKSKGTTKKGNTPIYLKRDIEEIKPVLNRYEKKEKMANNKNKSKQNGKNSRGNKNN